MDKSQDRWERISKELDDLKMNYERFSAIEGKKLREDEIEAKTTFAVRNFLCSYSVLGCALSHLAVWEKIANGSDKFVCIAEDDATFLEPFPAFLEEIDEIYDKTHFDVINLYGDFIPSGKTVYKNKNYSLVNPIFCLSLCCYIVSKDGARKMVDKINGKIRFQVDSYVAFLNLNDTIKQLVLTGLEIVKPSLEESTINKLNSGGVANKIMGSSFLMKYKKYINANAISFRLKYPVSYYLIILLTILVISLLKKWYVLSAIIGVEIFMLIYDVEV